MTLNIDAQAPSYTPTESPFLSSYAGMSEDELIGLAGAQQDYHQAAPFSNQSKALQDIQAASEATDPNLQMQLLEKALQELTPNSQGGPQSPISAQPGTEYQGGSPGAVPPGGSSPASPTGDGTTDPGASSGTLTSNPANNTIDTGRYLIQASKGDDGSVTITDKETGKTTEVWGDPHVKSNGNDVADFQKDDLNIQLQDGSVVHIQPTAEDGNGKAHIAQVSVTNGDQAATMSGFGSGDTLNTSSVMQGDGGYQSGLYNTPSATDITMGADGNLYANNANGSMGSEITQTNGGETDLDGSGGGLVNQPAASSAATGTTGAPSADSGTMQQLMDQVLEAVVQNASGMDAGLMQQMLSQMMSNSGYQQA